MAEEIQNSQTNATVEPSEGVVDQTTEVNSVSPAEASESVTQEQKQENRVPVSEIIAERDRRRAAEERAKIMEQEVNQLRQQVVPQQPKPKDPLEGLEEEDLVNVRSVREYIKNVESSTNQKINALRINQSVVAARMKYPDYDEIIQHGRNVISPSQLPLIEAADSPAETAYLFIKASPQYVQSLTQDTVKKTAKETVDTINRHTNKVKTLSNSGGTATKGANQFDNMSDEEFNKVQSAIKFRDKEVLKQYGL